VTGISILGATGSIGDSTLDVLRQHPDDFEVIALTANRNVAKLSQHCAIWQPAYAVMADADAAQQLQQQLKAHAPHTQVLHGTDGLKQVATLAEVEVVMAAIVGAAGLMPTLAAAQAGKRVLLANKEALVMSGQLFMDAVNHHQAELLPIDSEHNAVFQCSPPPTRNGHSLAQRGIDKILLTASGGPFRDVPLSALHDVSPDQACAHPNWQMGRKISVDSATMMNKGLEVIEACWLFNAQPAQVDVLIHPQSIVHSLVAYHDGSVLAQLGNPDMRTPIAHALGFPDRISAGVTPLDLAAIGQLDFYTPDTQRFPCLRLAYDAMQVGGTSTTILNAANEIAVDAFLQQRLRFTAIPNVVETTLSHLTARDADELTYILDADAEARQFTSEVIAQQ